MTPEQKAGCRIDALLVSGGWHECDAAHTDLGCTKQFLLFSLSEAALA